MKISQKEKIKISKKWAISTLLLMFFSCLTIILLNYINDPLWVFNHQNITNKTRLGFNERQQKTNLLYFGNKNYNSIMLGNSKTTYINQNKFIAGKAFNYAASAMTPEEFKGYLDFFKKVTKSNPKYIIIGVDFNYCTNENNKRPELPAQFYIKETTSQFYKTKHLISYNSFIYTIRNLNQIFENKNAIYFHDNSKIKIGFDKGLIKNFVPNLDLIKKETEQKSLDLTYNQKNIEIFRKLKKENENSQFVIIFLPDLLPYFTINSNKNLYQKCLKDMEDIFDKKNIFNFMELNEINSNPNNYYEKSHFRSEIGDIIITKISKELLKNY